MLKQKRSPRQRYLSTHASRHGTRTDDLYGAFYPANHLRLISFLGDPEDLTRGLLAFDRDLAAMPGDVNLWCGQKKAFYPTQVNPRVVRVCFNCPIAAGAAWTIDPSLGGFRGADGCAEALAASGSLQTASGPLPAGKIFIAGIVRQDSTTLDFQFSTPVNTTGDASGFWCMDEFGSTQSGSSIVQPAPEIIRVSFMSTIQAAPAPAGIVAGFTGISEYTDLLSPVTWRV